MQKDFISIKNLKKREIEEIFSLAEEFKKERILRDCLKGKTFALIFQKPSNRTRVSFEVGVTQLGGHTIHLGPEELKLGVRESVSDVAKVLSRYVDGIVARTYNHPDIINLAKSSTVPVLNGLSDLLHPCQALSDLFTIKEKFGKFDSIKLVFIGDGNNVLNSLLYGASIVGCNMAVINPEGYGPKKEVIEEAEKICKKSGAKVTFFNKPSTDLLKDADIVYTDVWISMGQENERVKRLKSFVGFQVNKNILIKAKKDCKIMHCMPAHRGEEITSEELDGPNSIVLDQAENRLHVQKAILSLLMRRR